MCKSANQKKDSLRSRFVSKMVLGVGVEPTKAEAGRFTV